MSDDDTKVLVHGLRGSFEEGDPAWPHYRCDFCGRAPSSAEDAYDWCPMSGDSWCCTNEPCVGELNGLLRKYPHYSARHTKS